MARTGPSRWLEGTLAEVGSAAAVGAFDVLPRRHSVLRNYPLVGRPRYGPETLRPEDIAPDQLRMVIDVGRAVSYAEHYGWLAPGQLLESPRAGWEPDLALVRASTFARPLANINGGSR
jgi:hypothetical protein